MSIGWQGLNHFGVKGHKLLLILKWLRCRWNRSMILYLPIMLLLRMSVMWPDFPQLRKFWKFEFSWIFIYKNPINFSICHEFSFFFSLDFDHFHNFFRIFTFKNSISIFEITLVTLDVGEIAKCDDWQYYKIDLSQLKLINQNHSEDQEKMKENPKKEEEETTDPFRYFQGSGS